MEQKDVVIIGGGPAGLSAAIFTQFDGWNTLVLEANWVGGQAAIASTVTNYPGFPPGDGAVLIDNLEKQVTSSLPAGVGADLRREKVVRIDAERRIVATEANQYQAKVIIIATGSTMQKLGIPGEDKFAGKGVSYYAKRDASEFANKRILVVGGGNSTAKSALVAKAAGANQVTLVHRRESLRAYSAMVKRLGREGIEIWYNTEVEEIKGTGQVDSAVVANNVSDEKREIAADWIVICVGTEPDTRLAQEARLEMMGSSIKVNYKMMTSRQGIFACGEITGADRHLISSAASGASAGMAASEYMALEMVRNGGTFEGAINGKYADEYLAMLGLGE